MQNIIIRWMAIKSIVGHVHWEHGWIMTGVSSTDIVKALYSVTLEPPGYCLRILSSINCKCIRLCYDHCPTKPLQIPSNYCHYATEIMHQTCPISLYSPHRQPTGLESFVEYMIPSPILQTSDPKISSDL